MKTEKILFIDRDGTLIEEPEDKQIDSIEKLAFKPGVFSALLQLKAAGYSFVLVSNQDGLGTDSFPQANFILPQELMLRIFASQDIYFDSIRICPHKIDANCECRKPRIGLIQDYVKEQRIDRETSYVIGDRETDIQLAENLGIKSIHFGRNEIVSWAAVAKQILSQPRSATVSRKTNETEIAVKIDLDHSDVLKIETGVNFLDHMLEQLAKHAGFSLSLSVKGDLHIDDHHTVEDIGIVLGEALRKALGDKRGIARYGFLLPMDESLTQVVLDLSGRFYFIFNGTFARERVGDLSTELVPHFFRSFAENLKANLHIDVKGENTHHMIESIFKGVGRTLRQAINKTETQLPSTKGIL